MAKLSVDDILDAIKELSIIEAADLSKIGRASCRERV